MLCFFIAVVLVVFASASTTEARGIAPPTPPADPMAEMASSPLAKLMAAPPAPPSDSASESGSNTPSKVQGVPLVSRFASANKCHQICDPICKKWGDENYVSPPNTNPPDGPTCQCSCCEDGTGLFCYKCRKKSTSEPSSCTSRWNNRILPLEPA